MGDGVEMLIMSIMGRNSKDKGVRLRSTDMGPLWGRRSWKRERLEIKSPARSRTEVQIWGRFGGRCS